VGLCRPSEITPLAAKQWLTHSDAAIRDRAAKLFGAATGDRQKVLDQYQSVPSSPAMRTRQGTFRQSLCHLS